MPEFKAEDHRLTNPDYARPESESNQVVREQRSVQGVVSFLSSTEREGPWELPRRFRALAVLGNIELDLRGARGLDERTVMEVLIARLTALSRRSVRR